MSLLLLFPTGVSVATAPTVSTDSVNSVLANSAVANGTVSSDGDADISERGFVYATTPTPTTSNNKAVVSGTIGSYSTRISALSPNTTYYIRAYAINSVGTSYGDSIIITTRRLDIIKHYLYRVTNSVGTYKATWVEEVISAPRFKNIINQGPSELVIKLARPFDDFGEDDDVAVNNIVECYCVDSDVPNGLLIYKGYVSGYKPVVSETTEYLEVTVFPFASELARMVLRDQSGNTTLTYSSQDPSNILKNVIDLYRQQGGKIYYSSSSIVLTNTVVSYTFNTNTTKEALDKIIELCPVGWYYTISPQGLISLMPRNDVADHTFTLGLDIENLETYRRIEDLVNQVLFTGGGDPPLFRKYQNTSSISSYGLHEVKLVDERVTVVASAQTISERLINTKKDPEIRSSFTIVDNSGPRNRGYDIEEVNVGETLRVKNLKISTNVNTLWDVALWDVDVWDQSIASQAADVIQILSVEYSPDSIQIEASSRLPQIAKRIEDISRNLENSQTANNPTIPS